MGNPPPHVSALGPAYEREPAKRVPRNWRPFDGVPYKVEDGDNFESLAVFAGVPVWDLIYFNFLTKVPQEVNWYLRNHVGCKKTTFDRKNFSFSSDADPGIIYFPSRAYRRLVANGKNPRRIVLEEVAFTVGGSVPTLFQGWKPACWAASIAMMVRWKKRHSKSVPEILEEAGKRWSIKYNRDQALLDPEMEVLTRKFGLTGEPDLPLTPNEWLQKMRRHGPLMVAQKEVGNWVHWIVVTGIRTEFPDKVELTYNEPGNGTRQSKALATMLSKGKAVANSVSHLFRF